jgi:ParB-like chromosome segregation protein Spo0J
MIKSSLSLYMVYYGMNINELEVVTKNIEDVELHKLTESHPLMTPLKYEAFKQSIATHGQRVPVLLYRGKIVDGRHRLRALMELDVAVIVCSIIPNNTTLEEVEELVLITEDRRHQTTAQLAISAYYKYKSGDYTQAQACKLIGCSLTNLKYAIRIEKFGREDILKTLRDGYKVDVSRDSRYPKMTDSLPAIVGKLKEDNDILELANKKLEEYEQSEGRDVEAEVDNPQIDAVERTQIGAIKAMVGTLSDKAKRALIAEIYKEGINND